jgi:NAD(P)-dependent dehydrogenase (short-subunit alcohol dehydrogenase family)
MKGTALITGSGKRIGKFIAIALAEKGFNIALNYHSSVKEAEAIAKEIKSIGVQCQLFQCDFNDFKSVSRLIKKVFDYFPDCNLLINNASIFERARLMDTDHELFDRHINVNFKAPFFLSQDFSRNCEKGQIINIIDTKISATLIKYFIYTLTKKALFEFTRMAAKELGPSIRVNAVSPGLILPSFYQKQEDFDKMSEQIPLKRKGNIEDLFSAIWFLIENPFITGECIFVDGGEHIR